MAENKKKSTDIKIAITKKTPTGSKKSSGSNSGKSKNSSRGSINHNKQSKKPSDKLIHKFIPFMFFVAALLLLVCLIFGSSIGFVGEWIRNILGGLMGTASFLFVALLVYFGIIWRRMIDSHRIVYKTVMILLAVVFFAATCDVILIAVLGKEADGFNIVKFYTDGGLFTGGGIIGGMIGWLCFQGMKLFSLIPLIPAIIIFMMLVLDVTPQDVIERIKRSNAKRAERRAIERAEREKEELEAAKRQKEEKNYSDKPEPDIPDNDENRFRNAVIRESKEEPAVEQEPISVAPMPEPIKEEKAETVEETGEFRLNDIFSEKEIDAMQAGGDDSSEFVDPLPYDADGDEAQAAGVQNEKLKWTPPPIDLLIEDKTSKADLSESIMITKRKLYETLESFDIRVKDIGYSIGPTITRYEIYPDSGVRVRAIANLVDDIALNLAAGDIRIEAPIPNKPAVGVEVPNTVRATVRLRTILDTDTFRNSSPLTVCLGQDVGGKNIYFDIKKMPHMIIAGTTGSGKSVCINCIVCSLLYKNSPDKVKLIMIDPKKVEFSIYQHIPHLYCPVISDARKAAGALASAVAEMERRYTLIEDVGVRDIDAYNVATANDPDREYLPKLIIVIDELADLMMMAKADVEQFITRIAQKARAVGIHLIIGTQRPSVDVITGLIKANVPSRIACTVKSQVDSRTILDISGAEKLIGQGDMLFSPIGLAKPMRVQGSFLDDSEVARIIEFIKANNAEVVYNSAFMDSMEAAAANVGEKKTGGAALDAADMSDEGGDVKFRQAVEIAISEGKISTSLLQRKLEIGYGRAAKLIDRMEEMGYVSSSDGGNKPRKVLITKQEYYERSINDTVSED